MGKATYKVEGGKLIKVHLSAKGKKISKIKIMGDFFLHPEYLIDGLEKAFTGQVLDKENLSRHMKVFLEKNNCVLLGASPDDFVKCIMMAAD